MLEQLLTKTKIGIATATIALGTYGCATTPRIQSPLAEKAKALYKEECFDKDSNFPCRTSYPIFLLEF